MNVLADAENPTLPCLACAAIGLVFIVFPNLYLAINNGWHRRVDPIRSKALPRAIGVCMILLAAIAWWIHRPR